MSTGKTVIYHTERKRDSAINSRYEDFLPRTLVFCRKTILSMLSVLNHRATEFIYESINRLEGRCGLIDKNNK
jgi:hypothetical protein